MINRVILVGRLTRDPMLRRPRADFLSQPSPSPATVGSPAATGRTGRLISSAAWPGGNLRISSASMRTKGRWSALTDGFRHGTMTTLPVRKCTSQKLSVTAYSCWNRNRLLKIVLQRWAISRRMLAMLRRTRSGTLRRTMDSMISALARHWIFPAMTYHFN